MVRLHFGRSFGTGIEVLWVITGLAPCVLIVTGALMWWNRVVRKTMDRSGQTAPVARHTPTELPEEASVVRTRQSPPATIA
jgi:uncharacterized iron-regulated membrane protein